MAIEAVTSQVAAYYTISAASIPLVDLPPEETKRLPRYPTVPAVRIGRLAVDQRFQGRGLGGALLADAASRMLKADAAAFTLLVDAKNDQAVAGLLCLFCHDDHTANCRTCQPGSVPQTGG